MPIWKDPLPSEFRSPGRSFRIGRVVSGRGRRITGVSTSRLDSGGRKWIQNSRVPALSGAALSSEKFLIQSIYSPIQEPPSIIHNVVVLNTAAQPFTDQTADEPPVRGFLHAAAKVSAGLVLTHGAGGNCNAPLLVALAESFSTAGITVLRCDLPFRQKRPHGPPSPASAKLDQEGLRRAVTLLRKLLGGQGRLFLGGQSYGGRQASMLAASEPSLVKGLLLLSYPLHPPGRPTQLRTAHFPTLRTPTLFIQGTKDPFGSIEEMESAVKLIPAQTKLRVQGVGHSLLSKSNKNELVNEVVQAFLDFPDNV